MVETKARKSCEALEMWYIIHMEKENKGGGVKKIHEERKIVQGAAGKMFWKSRTGFKDVLGGHGGLRKCLTESTHLSLLLSRLIYYSQTSCFPLGEMFSTINVTTLLQY